MHAHADAEGNNIHMYVCHRMKVMYLRGHNASVFSVSFAADSKTIATVSRDGYLKLWSIDVRYEVSEDPKLLASFVPEGPHNLERVALSPDGKVGEERERKQSTYTEEKVEG